MQPFRWFPSFVGVSLLIATTIVLILLLQSQITPRSPTRLAAEQPITALPDSPLPTPNGTIIINEPTWTPIPTLPAPPTPTIPSGPSPTPLPLPTPAKDAAGTITYAVYDAVDELAIHTISIDENGIAQTKSPLVSQGVRLHGRIFLASPDGNRLVSEDGFGIHHILYLDSSKIEPLFRDNLEAGGFVFAWHPDNTHILMRAQQNYPDVGLWLVDVDNGRHTTLFAQYPSPNIISGAISPDGQRVVYSTPTDFMRSDLWIVNVDGSNRHRIYQSDTIIFGLAWSPDNHKIVFIGDGLMVMDMVESNPRKLTNNIASDYDFKPVWSRDGQKLAFVGTKESALLETTVQNASGLEDRQMSAFVGATIHIFDLNTEDEYPLLPDGNTGNIDPTWSPDGSQLAFSSFYQGSFAVRIVHVDGANLREIVSSQKPIRYVAWSR
jgi:Tol biopolymer transport system component